MGEAEEKVEKANGDMVEVRVELFKPFHDFLRQYLEFFGSKQTVSDICRNIVCDKVKSLYRAFEEFQKEQVGHVEKEAWYNKHTYIAITSFRDEEEENEG